jgi:O-antigen/teichoic acid export membrane protein
VPYLLVQPGLLLLGLAAFHFLGFARLTAFVAMTLNVAAMFVSVAIGSVLLHGSLPSIARKTPRAYEVRGWIQSALPLILIGGILIAGNQIGAIALGTTRSSADIAVYNAAARMSEALTFVLTAVNIPIAPAASRLMTMGDGATLQRIVRKAVRAAVAFSIPIALILVIARGPLLSLFGRGFERGGTALILLVIGQLVNVAAGAVGVLLIMTGHQRTAARGFGLGVLATASLTLGLAPGLGVVGAALGTMLGTIIWNTILAVMTIRRLGINPTVFARPVVTLTATMPGGLKIRRTRRSRRRLVAAGRSDHAGSRRLTSARRRNLHRLASRSPDRPGRVLGVVRPEDGGA